MRRWLRAFATAFAIFGMVGCSGSDTTNLIGIGSVAGAQFALCVDSATTYDDYATCADASERRMLETSDGGSSLELSLERAAADVAMERKLRMEVQKK